VEGFLPRDFFVRECIQFFVFRLMCDWTGEGKIERKWKPRDETGKKNRRTYSSFDPCIL
jgi:hypothetical protein